MLKLVTASCLNWLWLRAEIGCGFGFTVGNSSLKESVYTYTYIHPSLSCLSVLCPKYRHTFPTHVDCEHLVVGDAGPPYLKSVPRKWYGS